MSFPVAPATKANLDSGADDPSQARAELAFLVDRFNELLGLLSQAPGANQIPVLDAGGNMALAGETAAFLNRSTWASAYQIAGDRPGTVIRAKTGIYLLANADVDSAGVYHYLSNGPAALVYIDNSGTMYRYTAASGTTGAAVTFGSPSTFWHSGNDGASSGLDAGLLAGHDPTYFINTGNIGSQTVTKATMAPYTRGESGLRIIRGEVNDDGTIKHGAGFTVSGTSPSFTITWANAFTEAPTVVATTGSYVFVRDDAGPYTTSWSCSTVLSNNNGATAGFRFIAIGKD